MKSKITLLLFFIACFTGLPAFGQNLREARIFVPPVTGPVGAEERAFFHQKLTYEVILQYHELARSRGNCEYILRGSIMPLDEFTLIQEELAEVQKQNFQGPVPNRPIPPVRNTMDRREFFSWDIDNSLRFFDTTGEDNYIPLPQPPQLPPPAARPRLIEDGLGKVFLLELIHSVKNEVVARGFIIYQNTDASVNDELAIMVYDMFSLLPEIQEYSDWRNKWVFFEVSALWAPRLYANEGNSLNLANFGVKAALDVQLLNFLSISAGAQVTQDWIVITGAAAAETRDFILEIPLALKLVFKPAGNFMLEPYGGLSWNHSLMNTTEPSVYSWFAGLQIGIQAGPGMVFLDGRFSQDFASSSTGTIEYQRSMLQIGFGYKFGIFSKKPTIHAY
jgi:hypothetical protein